jgi:hypothetical protein
MVASDASTGRHGLKIPRVSSNVVLNHGPGYRYGSAGLMTKANIPQKKALRIWAESDVPIGPAMSKGTTRRNRRERGGAGAEAVVGAGVGSMMRKGSCEVGDNPVSIHETMVETSSETSAAAGVWVFRGWANTLSPLFSSN